MLRIAKFILFSAVLIFSWLHVESKSIPLQDQLSLTLSNSTASLPMQDILLKMKTQVQTYSSTLEMLQEGITVEWVKLFISHVVKALGSLDWALSKLINIIESAHEALTGETKNPSDPGQLVKKNKRKRIVTTATPDAQRINHKKRQD